MTPLKFCSGGQSWLGTLLKGTSTGIEMFHAELPELDLVHPLSISQAESPQA